MNLIDLRIGRRALSNINRVGRNEMKALQRFETFSLKLFFIVNHM